MKWVGVNASLSMAQGRGYSYSVRKLAEGDFYVKQDSFTNGGKVGYAATEEAAVALAEQWEANR